MFWFFAHHVFDADFDVLIWSWGTERSNDICVISNLRGDQMINLIVEPFSIFSWELSWNSSCCASRIGNHKFTPVILQEIIWAFGIMNLSSRFIPVPLLRPIVSHLMFKEEISTRPVSSPVFRIGGEDEIVIGFLIIFFNMKIHASFWLHSCKLWLFLHILYSSVKLLISITVKNFNIKSDITIIWNYTSTEWCFSSGSTPCLETWAGKSGVIALMQFLYSEIETFECVRSSQKEIHWLLISTWVDSGVTDFSKISR